MSAMLESLLDDERRVRCRANDAAVATGRPIIDGQPTTPPVRCINQLHPHTVPARSKRSNAALMATDEFR